MKNKITTIILTAIITAALALGGFYIYISENATSAAEVDEVNALARELENYATFSITAEVMEEGAKRAREQYGGVAFTLRTDMDFKEKRELKEHVDEIGIEAYFDEVLEEVVAAAQGTEVREAVGGMTVKHEDGTNVFDVSEETLHSYCFTLVNNKNRYDIDLYHVVRMNLGLTLAEAEEDNEYDINYEILWPGNVITEDGNFYLNNGESDEAGYGFGTHYMLSHYFEVTHGRVATRELVFNERLVFYPDGR